MNNEFLPAYKVYQQVIDLELYYAFVDLVVHTSQEEKAWEIYRNIVDTQIWQQKAEGQNYFEAYNLRYPGEVLERFEEKLGKDVRIIRALALALGKTRALQSDNMFVGNQRGSFLQMIRRTSNGDAYLQGALYLLETDMPRRHALLDKLAATEYAKTEDLFKNPLHPYTKGLLDAVPIPSLKAKKLSTEVMRGELTSPVDPAPGCRFAARCPYATDACRGRDIPLKEVEPGHFVSCTRF